MERQFTLGYWIDDGWDVGKIQGVPGVFSQGESLEELEENIKDAYLLTLQEELHLDVAIFANLVVGLAVIF